MGDRIKVRYDGANLLRQVGGNRRLAMTLMKTFVEDLPRIMSRLRRAIRDGKPSAISTLGHDSKSTFSLLNFEHAHDLAAYLHRHAWDDEPDLIARLSELELEITAARAIAKKILTKKLALETVIELSNE
jgi:hypothetical protein